MRIGARVAGLFGLAAVVAVAFVLAVVPAAPAGAQEPAPTTIVPLDDQPIRSPSIIPTPNSSSQPTQYVVMVAVVGGLAAIVLLVVRESRRNPDQRTPTPGTGTPPASDPGTSA